MCEDSSRERVVLWDTDRYIASLLSGVTECRILVSEEELMDTGWTSSHISGAIILAGLTWNNHRRTDFHGFEIVYRLRAEHRLQCPIVLCSFMPESYLRMKFPVLDFPQHPFIRLPTDAQTLIATLDAAPAADKSRLNHILMYCGLQGRLERLLTHGRGMPFFTHTQRVEESTLDAQMWRNLQADCELLGTYLKGESLSQDIVRSGNRLADTLSEACQTQDPNKLYDAKDYFKKLLAILQEVDRS